MNAIKLTFSAALIVFSQFVFAQTGNWQLAGNNLTGTEKFGSTNSAALNFITNNKTRMSLTKTGNLNISSDQSSIQFANPGTNPRPMIFMFSSGTSNPNRMVIAHSPANPNWGLQYNDVEDRFDFLRGGNSIFSVNLGNSTVKVTRGSSGAAAFSNAPLVIENSTDNYINLLAPDANETGILFGKPQSNVSGGLIYNNSSTTNGLQFRTNGNLIRMVLTNTGRLGIGTATPAAEAHILHGVGNDGNHGLRLQNSGNGKHWTLHTSDINGSLWLWANGNLRGDFDNISGNYTSLSDARSKKDIEKAPDLLEKVIQLDVKKYHFLENKSTDKKYFGLIAQEVENIFPEVVYHNKMDGGNNDLYTMNYSAFGVLAIKAIQEQQQKIVEQEQTNQQQQQKIISLEDRIAKLEAAINKGNISNTGNNTNVISKEISGATLEQNQPNPFNQSTVIRYHLPQGTSGQINLYDANGMLVQTLKANESGQAVINGNDLSAGTYSYTLVANGKITASKKLVLIK